MNITHTSPSYNFNQINSEHFGFIKVNGAYSAVYEQRNKREEVVRCWQWFVEKPQDVLDFLSDFSETLEKAVKEIGKHYFMVRV